MTSDHLPARGLVSIYAYTCIHIRWQKCSVCDWTAVAGSGDALPDPQNCVCCVFVVLYCVSIMLQHLSSSLQPPSSYADHRRHRSPAQSHLPLWPEPCVNCQALRTIRDRVAVAFEVAVATRKSIVLLATLLSWAWWVGSRRIRTYQYKLSSSTLAVRRVYTAAWKDKNKLLKRNTP